MVPTLELVRRAVRLRGLPLALLFVAASACDTHPTNPVNIDPPNTPVDHETDGGLSTPVAFAGGIPFGHFAQPATDFGPVYNGAKLTLQPEELLPALAAVKARGGKATILLAGANVAFQDSDGHFSLAMWKARVDRFRSVDFSSYVRDGTIIGHYLLDEPNDPNNWNGRAVAPALLEEAARYSKQIWPEMATIVRTQATYLARWEGTYQYLDAAWAQYAARMGPVDQFLSRNVIAAHRKGLALVVGLNVLHGGGAGRIPMTATQVVSWGSVLLSSSYPCAFISWRHDPAYLSSPGVEAAMSVLRSQAQSRPTRTCQGS